MSFSFDLAPTGDFGKDFAKGLAVPFQAVGQVGGIALGGVGKGVAPVIGDALGGVGQGLEAALGIPVGSGKFILAGGAALLLVYIFRRL